MFQQENDELLTSMFNRTFFTEWKTHDPQLTNFSNIELILNYKCNLACKYCYIDKYGEKLYPHKLYENEEKLLHNTDLILSWLLENNFSPKIEFFSGEALVQSIGFDVLNRILDRLGGKMSTKIVIPTNFTFLLSKKLTNRVEELLYKSRKVNVPIYLSASFDGKYCDSNRPFRNRKRDPRDDEYYNKCFSFAKKWKVGFHPMIYSEHIEDWKKNFLWFQHMFKEHDIPWHNLYLLEIRNANWNTYQTLEFGKFIKFLINWLWDRCGRDLGRYCNAVFNKRGFNILSGPLSTYGRGIGCSIQSTFFLRIGDLAIVPCHRLSYDPFIIGHLEVKNDKITGITSRNIELGITKHTFSASMFPYCEECLIRSLCSFGCLGAQFETTGDIFTPIPTVCRLQYAKVNSMVTTYKEIGILDSILGHISPEKEYAIRRLFKI